MTVRAPERTSMTHAGPHLLTIVGTSVFVLSACLILALRTATFAAIWVGAEPAALSPRARPARRWSPAPRSTLLTAVLRRFVHAGRMADEPAGRA